MGKRNDSLPLQGFETPKQLTILHPFLYSLQSTHSWNCFRRLRKTCKRLGFKLKMFYRLTQPFRSSETLKIGYPRANIDIEKWGIDPQGFWDPRIDLGVNQSFLRGIDPSGQKLTWGTSESKNSSRSSPTWFPLSIWSKLLDLLTMVLDRGVTSRAKYVNFFFIHFNVWC